MAEPEVLVHPAIALSHEDEDWLCAWCNNRVASDKERFCLAGRSEFSFTNPDGIRFEILTFSRAFGCVVTGAPTQANTWFPGHAWCYAQCDSCARHLGWHYSGPSVFTALIATRIVRAVYIRN